MIASTRIARFSAAATTSKTRRCCVLRCADGAETWALSSPTSPRRPPSPLSSSMRWASSLSPSPVTNLSKKNRGRLSVLGPSINDLGHYRWSSSHGATAATATAVAEEDPSSNPAAASGVLECLPDFFGEPVTFLRPPEDSEAARLPPPSTPASAVQFFDEYLLCVVSRGSSSDLGGNADGVEIRAAHSSAITWAGLVRRAVFLPGAPMLSCAAVAPLLAQGGGTAYVRRVDGRLKLTGDKSPSLIRLAERAAALANHPSLNAREIQHLRALRRLLDDDLPGAAAEYLSLLRSAPGDLFALSVLLDVSAVLGDASPAFAGGGCVASYWSDRPSNLGAAIASSLVSAAFASAGKGGRTAEAERLADDAIRRDKDTTGGVGGYALAMCYESQGRSSEGQSLLCGYDGVRRYEGCGFMGWDSRLSGMGAMFACDRDGAGADRVATRMYDHGFGRLVSYGDARNGVDLRAPGKMEGVMKQTGGFFKSLLGGKAEKWREEQEEKLSTERTEALSPSTMEDVLTFLPPTPHLLVEATMLLLRLTLSGAVEPTDERWVDLREAWKEIIAAHHAGWQGLHFPARVASALVLEEDALGGPGDGSTSEGLGNNHRVSVKLTEAGRLLGRFFCLGRVDGVTTDSNGRQLCRQIVQLLTEAREGVSSPIEGSHTENALDSPPPIQLLHQDLSGYDHLLRPLTEHALVRCALRSADPADLAAARSSCSEAVALRSNCPEVWWRYGEVLDALGDNVAAEGARSASISLGSGEGGHFR